MKENKVKTLVSINTTFLEVNVDEVRLENDHIAKRDFIKHPGGVCIIAMKDNKLMLVKQFRYSLNDYTYEIPGGKLEENYTLEELAKKELNEETGYDCEKIEFLYSAALTPGYSNEICHFFFTDSLFESKNKLAGDVDEFTEVMFVDETFFTNDKVIDGRTLSAYYFYLGKKK